MNPKPKLLFVGDICVDTGFARVTRSILERLRETWDINVIGVNANGDPSQYEFPIWPARNGGDLWGLGQLSKVCNIVQPDIICVLNDPWIISRFATEIDRGDIPMVAYMPVDARGQGRGYCQALNKLDMAIFYTHFGENTCRLAGYSGPSAVVPHGVDTELYYPRGRRAARAKLDPVWNSLGENAFIIGNVNRNSPRKRLDLTIQYFAEWLRQRAGAPDRIENAYLYLHCSPRDTGGCELRETADFYGVGNRLILADPEAVRPDKGIDEALMPLMYSALDVQVSTTAGEGWSLTVHEGMACGVPQIAPQYAALGEWAAGAAWLVPCTSYQLHPGCNTLGGIPDKQEFIKALDLFYRRPDLREAYAQKALARAKEPRFQWSAVAAQFDQIFRGLVERKFGQRKQAKETETAPIAAV